MGKIDSRDKGARYERHVAQVLRAHGYEAERGCQHSGGSDSPDVKHNMGNIHLECKAVERLNLWSALSQSERDAGEGEIAAVVFKRNRSKDYIALPFEDFLKIYNEYMKGENND